MKTLIITTLFFLFHLSEYSQDLSLLQSFTVKIENEENIPTVSENDDNTLNVIFKQQHINEIFSKYKLFSFKKNFPTTNSETLRKLYTFSCNSRAIVNELVNNVSSEVLFFDFPFEVNSIDDEMKQDFKSAQKFSLKSYTYTSEESCHDKCIFKPVKMEEVFTVEIFYDATTDAIIMKSIGETPLGIEFTFHFKSFNIGSFKHFGIWETYSNKNSILANEENASKPEYLFFQTMFADVQLINFQKTDDKTLIIRNPNGIFGEDVFQFSSETLSIKQEKFSDYIEISLNPMQNQLYLSNKNSFPKITKISIYDSLGKKVINKKKDFSTINTSQLQAGLYFLQVYLGNNVILRKKMFKN